MKIFANREQQWPTGQLQICSLRITVSISDLAERFQTEDKNEIAIKFASLVDNFENIDYPKLVGSLTNKSSGNALRYQPGTFLTSIEFVGFGLQSTHVFFHFVTLHVFKFFGFTYLKFCNTTTTLHPLTYITHNLSGQMGKKPVQK